MATVESMEPMKDAFLRTDEKTVPSRCLQLSIKVDRLDNRSSIPESKRILAISDKHEYGFVSTYLKIYPRKQTMYWSLHPKTTNITKNNSPIFPKIGKSEDSHLKRRKRKKDHGNGSSYEPRLRYWGRPRLPRLFYKRHDLLCLLFGNDNPCTHRTASQMEV